MKLRPSGFLVRGHSVGTALLCGLGVYYGTGENLPLACAALLALLSIMNCLESIRETME